MLPCGYICTISTQCNNLRRFFFGEFLKVKVGPNTLPMSRVYHNRSSWDKLLLTSTLDTRDICHGTINSLWYHKRSWRLRNQELLEYKLTKWVCIVVDHHQEILSFVTRLWVFFFNLGYCMQSFFLFVAPTTIWKFGANTLRVLSSKHSFGFAFQL